MTERLTKQELVRLVEKLMSGEGTEDEGDKWLTLLEVNVPDPGVSDLIFWPNTRGLPDDLTAEQVVEIALSYKPNPVLLGPTTSSEKARANPNIRSHKRN